MKISLSRLIMGIIFLIVGVVFIVLAISVHWSMVFYGIIFLVLGIVLLLNKNEDKIEKRKDLKESEYHK